MLLGTPLGNLEDISIRQLKSIVSAKYIFAEDTRSFLKLRSLILERYSKLFENLEVEAREFILNSYRDQNHKLILPKVLSLLENGEDVYLVSDAGMPAISDPGYLLIKDVLNQGFEIETIPGSTAPISALLLSGLPTDRFVFLGFLPRKNGKILELIKPFIATEITIVFFESPFRISKVVEFIGNNFPNLRVSASNDITKKFEKTLRGGTKDIIDSLSKSKVQGEWVVCLSSKDIN